MTMIANGKGNKSRFVPLKEELLEALTAWEMPAEGRLWDINPQQMSKILSAFLKLHNAKRDDGKPATAHCLRHWYGTELYRATKDILLVRDLMGHESVATTQIYAQSDTSKSAPAVALLSVSKASD